MSSMWPMEQHSLPASWGLDALQGRREKDSVDLLAGHLLQRERESKGSWPFNSRNYSQHLHIQEASSGKCSSTRPTKADPLTVLNALDRSSDTATLPWIVFYYCLLCQHLVFSEKLLLRTWKKCQTTFNLKTLNEWSLHLTASLYGVCLSFCFHVYGRVKKAF